jgi:hypothetical protein
MGFNKKNTVCFRFILSADRYWTLIAVILDYFLLLKAFKPLQTCCLSLLLTNIYSAFIGRSVEKEKSRLIRFKKM